MNIVERAQLKMEKISRLNMGDYLCVARYHLFSFECILRKEHKPLMEKNVSKYLCVAI